MLKAVVVGNIGNEPEMQYSANGGAFIRFNVASNYRTKGQDGEWTDQTEWLRVTLFGKRAESLANYLKKGSRVYVDGRLEARPWTDKNGTLKAGLEVMADTVEFVSSRQDDQATERPATPARRTSRDLEDVPF